MTTYFIGLGPKGDRVAESELSEFLNGSELGPVVGSLRSKGSCAFVTLADGVDGEQFRTAFDGKTVGECRLSVQESRGRNNNNNGGRQDGGRIENGGNTVFIGLGPNSASVSDDQLRAALEESGPLVGAIRRRGQCSFADFSNPDHAAAAVTALHGITLGDCRLSVQISRNNRNNGGGGNDRNGGRNDRRGGGDRKRDRSRSRRRSRSRSRGRRDDSRRRHRSDSRDSRRRRDDRDERRERRREDRHRSPS